MLKPSPKYRHLAAATDMAAIKPVLQRKLGEIWGHPVAMRHLTVRRIWRAKSASLWIGYAFSKNAEEPDKTERLFGKLLSPGEVPMRWEESSQTLFLPRFSMALSIFLFDAKLKT